MRKDTAKETDLIQDRFPQLMCLGYPDCVLSCRYICQGEENLPEGIERNTGFVKGIWFCVCERPAHQHKLFLDMQECVDLTTKICVNERKFPRTFFSH